MREHGTLHIPDVRTRTICQLAESRMVGLAYALAWCLHRLARAVPLARSMTATPQRSASVHPYKSSLLETFADQAVIAIENVRLVQRIARNALEQQTADAAKFWASLPARQRIFSRCWVQLSRMLPALAMHRRCDLSCRWGGPQYWQRNSWSGTSAPADRATDQSRFAEGRAVVDRQTIHVHDWSARDRIEFQMSRLSSSTFGTRLVCSAPLLREDCPSGLSRSARRTESDRSLKSKSHFSKPLRMKRSSPSRMCGCLRNWMNEPTNWHARWGAKSLGRSRSSG